MLKLLKVTLASTLLALTLASAPAKADPAIVGSITVVGGVCPSCIPTPPSTSIVSALTGITHVGLGLTTSALGAFSAIPVFVANDKFQKLIRNTIPCDSCLYSHLHA